MRTSFYLPALIIPLLVSCDTTEPELPLFGTYSLHTWNGAPLPQESPAADFPRTLHRATLQLNKDGSYQEEWHYRNFYHTRQNEWTVKNAGRFSVTRDDRRERALEFRHGRWGGGYTATLERDGLRTDHGDGGVYLYRLE